MYQEQELAAVRAQIRKRWIALGIPCLIIFALQVYSLTIRNRTLTYITGIGLCLIMLFFFEMTIHPLIRYEKHVNAMLHGITHEITATFQNFDSNESLVDGLAFRAMNVICIDEEQKPYERFFYYDIEKPLPDLQKEDRIQITYHDRQVVALKKL